MSSTEPSAPHVWSVSLAKSAQKQLDKLPAGDFTRVDAAIESMRGDPFTGDVVHLTNAEAAFRRRVGDYGILFDVFRELSPCRRRGHPAPKHNDVPQTTTVANSEVSRCHLLEAHGPRSGSAPCAAEGGRHQARSTRSGSRRRVGPFVRRSLATRCPPVGVPKDADVCAVRFDSTGIAAQESPRATKPYDRTTDQVSLDEIERIPI
jgi:mRNA-degrading endonuclease RelE of RelBE toxin-antitoxin system